jgi:regulatory protein
MGPSPGPITALRESPRRKGRYVLEVGGGVIAPVSVEMVAEYGLRVGLELDEAALARVMQDAGRVACFDRALDALGRRSRSRAGLERWLKQRDYAADAITPSLDRLEALGLLDDAQFARGFARSRLVGRGFGPRRVAAELSRHGVARAVADAVLAELGAELAAERGDERVDGVEAAALRRAKSLQRLEPAVAERRLLGWLVRRGFGVGEARAAARWALAPDEARSRAS